MSKMILPTWTPQRRGPRTVAGLFLGIAMALALPSTTWAKSYQFGPQSLASNGLDPNGGSSNHSSGASVHLHHSSGQTQSQAIGPGSPPGPLKRKPRL